MWAEQELARVLATLEPVVTRAVVLKGHAIAPLVYPDPALRSTNDIDLLIRREDAAAANAALRATGYVETNLFPDRPESRERYHERVLSRELVPGRVRQPVELHTGFAQSFRHTIPYPRLIERAVPRGGGGFRLSDEDQLLHFAAHSGREQFLGPLKQLLDVHLWVIHRPLCWRTISRRAIQYGLATTLWETLRLTRALFGTPLPPEVGLAIGPGPLRRRWLRWWHTPGDHGLTRFPASMRTAQVAALLPLLDHGRDRLRFVGTYAAIRLSDLVSRRSPPT